jgi:CelD/BcsL family acetyltransferase involved in cellulose biosynthesis
MAARITPLDAARDLAAQWRDLETRAAPNTFLSWLWMGTWLDCYRPDGYLVSVHAGGSPIALGLFAQRDNVCLLHQTGIKAQDQIWIEYNGLLAEPGQEAPALLVAAQAMLTNPHCSMLHLSMLPEGVGHAVLSAFPSARIYQLVTGWQRDLASVRRQGGGILDALSANTRAQVRRSLRGYERRYGSASVERLETLEDALDAWREAGDRHRARWQDSGFRNPAFTDFHERLLKHGLDHGNVRLYRVAFGDTTVGVFHYLCDRGTVRFYLQGVKPEGDSKLKPGLTAHCLLMQHFLDDGWDNYDFMGGDSQYKRQLADRRTEFMTLRIHDGSMGHRLADVARGLRDRLRGATRS